MRSTLNTLSHSHAEPLASALVQRAEQLRLAVHKLGQHLRSLRPALRLLPHLDRLLHHVPIAVVRVQNAHHRLLPLAAQHARAHLHVQSAVPEALQPVVIHVPHRTQTLHDPLQALLQRRLRVLGIARLQSTKRHGEAIASVPADGRRLGDEGEVAHFDVADLLRRLVDLVLRLKLPVAATGVMRYATTRWKVIARLSFVPKYENILGARCTACAKLLTTVIVSCERFFTVNAT